MRWSFLVEGDNVFLTMNGKKVFDYHGGDLGPIEKAVYGRNQRRNLGKKIILFSDDFFILSDLPLQLDQLH